MVFNMPNQTKFKSIAEIFCEFGIGADLSLDPFAERVTRLMVVQLQFLQELHFASSQINILPKNLP